MGYVCTLGYVYYSFWSKNIFFSAKHKATGTLHFVGCREINQQDATYPMFIIKLLSQHVSGYITTIIRRTRPYITDFWCSALVVLAVVVWSCVVSCVHCVSRTVNFTQCTQLTTQLHTITASTTSAEHHM